MSVLGLAGGATEAGVTEGDVTKAGVAVAGGTEGDATGAASAAGGLTAAGAGRWDWNKGDTRLKSAADAGQTTR